MVSLNEAPAAPVPSWLSEPLDEVSKKRDCENGLLLNQSNPYIVHGLNSDVRERLESAGHNLTTIWIRLYSEVMRLLLA